MKKIILLTLISLILLVGCYNETETPSTATTSFTTTTVTAKETITNEATTMVTNEQEENELNLTWISDSILTYVELEDSDIDELNDYMFEVCTNKLIERYHPDVYIEYVKIGKYDLNDDGELDYFVLAYAGNAAGNGFPPMMLFLSDNGSYNDVDVPTKNYNRITLLKSKTNGLFDIKLDAFGGILHFDGNNTYDSDDEYISLLVYPLKMINKNTVCFEVSIPYRSFNSEVYNEYLKVAYFYNADWLENKVVVSNDENLDNIIYTEPPINGVYKFHVDVSHLENVDLDVLYDAYQYLELQEINVSSGESESIKHPYNYWLDELGIDWESDDNKFPTLTLSKQKYEPETFEKYFFGKWKSEINDKYFMENGNSQMSSGEVVWINDEIIFTYYMTGLVFETYWININYPDHLYNVTMGIVDEDIENITFRYYDDRIPINEFIKTGESDKIQDETLMTRFRLAALCDEYGIEPEMPTIEYLKTFPFTEISWIDENGDGHLKNDPHLVSNIYLENKNENEIILSTRLFLYGPMSPSVTVKYRVYNNGEKWTNEVIEVLDKQ